MLFAFNLSLSGQTLIQNLNSYSPPSPEAASLGNQSAKYSIDYYTGRLNYYAPVYTLNIEGIDIDLGLQYSTAGFKVQDVASSVGLGWNTAYSGVITRYIEGLPDEDANGYCGANQIGAKAYLTPNEDYLKKTTGGDWDSQPDKFIFSFQGFSGVFRLDANGIPIFESGMTGLKILYSPFNRSNGRNNGGAENWIVVDQLGNTYVFGENAIERTESTHHLVPTNKTRTFISSWYIKRITNIAQQSIEYLYETGPELSYTYFLNARRSTLTQGTCSLVGISDTDYNENIDIKVSQPLYLSTIRTIGSEIAVGFTYTNGREDLSGGRKLSEVSVRHSNVVKKRFLFNYDYFMENNEAASKRLKLNSIQEVSPSTGIVKEVYGFYYNESKNLPARNSIKTDYWGYYNNNQGSSNIEGYLNSSKLPSFDHSKASVLVKVKNATGGFLNFEFEQNDYFNGTSTTSGGGIRIKKAYETQIDLPTATQLNVKEYIYQNPSNLLSSGQVYTSQSNSQLRIDYLLVSPFGACVITQGYRYSEPIISIFDLNNVSVGYSIVAVKKVNGTTRYSFTNYQDRADIFDERKFDPSGSPDAPNNSNYNLAPQLPVTSNAKFRGKVLSEELFDISGQKVKSTIYSYLLTSQSTAVVGIKAFPISVITGNGSTTFSYVRYNFSTQDLRLSSKSETTYKNNLQISSSVENYTYSTYANNLIVKRATNLPGGRTMSESYRYACDIPVTVATTASPLTAPIQFLRDKNIIGTPIESIQSYTDQGQAEKVTAARLIKYKAINNQVVLPWKESLLELNSPILRTQFTLFQTNNVNGNESDINDSRYSERIINRYNVNGKVTQKIAAQDTSRRQSYIWGYKSEYPIAEIKNSSINEFYSQNFEEPELGLDFEANVTYDNTKSHTGKYSGRIINPNATEFVSHSSKRLNISLTAPKKFTFSGWVYSSGPSVQLFLFMMKAGETGYNTYNDSMLTSVTNRWVYMKKEFLVPSDVVQLFLRLDNNAAGTVWFDDLRIQPSDASMSTYTYEPLVGMTSAIDANGKTVLYEYDIFQRLMTIKDQNGNIVKSYDYHYKP